MVGTTHVNSNLSKVVSGTFTHNNDTLSIDTGLSKIDLLVVYTDGTTDAGRNMYNIYSSAIQFNINTDNAITDVSGGTFTKKGVNNYLTLKYVASGI